MKAGPYRTVCIQARMQTEVTPAVCTILIATREPPTFSKSSPTFPLMTCVWAACPDPLMDPYSLAKHTLFTHLHKNIRKSSCTRACTNIYDITSSVAEVPHVYSHIHVLSTGTVHTVHTFTYNMHQISLRKSWFLRNKIFSTIPLYHRVNAPSRKIYVDYILLHTTTTTTPVHIYCKRVFPSVCFHGALIWPLPPCFFFLLLSLSTVCAPLSLYPVVFQSSSRAYLSFFSSPLLCTSHSLFFSLIF